MLSGKHGCRPVITAAALCVCCTLPILAVSNSIPLLATALILLGAGVGTVDCIVNVQAVIVERASGRPMMSGFHGVFSVGGIAGAGGMSALLSAGLSPLSAACCAACVVALAVAVARPGLLTTRTTNEGPLFAIPKGIVLLIGMMCFVVFLTEGSALDWSAVILTTVRKVDLAYAGFGYVAFASTMTVGRVSGDFLVRRFERQKLLIVGALLAAFGLWVIAAIPAWQATILGYALVGAGCSNVVPVLYTAVGRQRRMPEHIAVPAISTLGYSGILLGPAAIGFVAAATSLLLATAAIGVLLIGVVIAATRLDLT
jgi:MFS family permease